METDKMKKIMIVDDEPHIVLSVKQALIKSKDADFEVIDAQNGKECLEMLENGEKPDLIILDIMMPGMDGWEVINRIQANYKWNKIPIIFLSAKIDSFTKTFGKSVAMDFIEKPFDIHDLTNRINSVLKKMYVKSVLDE
jgi:DNA-binding response OmpR family regulator